MMPSTTPSAEVLRVPDLAKILGTTEGSVRQMIARGLIPARKWGRRVVVLRADVESRLASLPAR